MQDKSIINWELHQKVMAKKKTIKAVNEKNIKINRISKYIIMSIKTTFNDLPLDIIRLIFEKVKYLRDNDPENIRNYYINENKKINHIYDICSYSKIDINFKKCIQGYHLINSSPIPDPMMGTEIPSPNALLALAVPLHPSILPYLSAHILTSNKLLS